MENKIALGSGGIRTHASEETGALNQRLRPLGHATLNNFHLKHFQLKHFHRKNFYLKHFQLKHFQLKRYPSTLSSYTLSLQPSFGGNRSFFINIV